MENKDSVSVPIDRRSSQGGPFATLQIPKNMGFSRFRNKSSPDIYEELLPKNSTKDQASSTETYIQSLRRISEHHQVIMIFVIGGITHSEIK